MLEQALAGAMQLLAWPAFGFLLLGVIIGIFFGLMPGLNGLNGMAILLPFTFTMDTVPALCFLLGVYAVTSTADTISSVLLGIPGTAASQATILDGHPMAKRGEAERAFGAAFTVSAIGGVIGAIAVVVSIPILRPIIMAFSSPEFFMLGLVGLTMVGALSGNSIGKGVAAAAVGLMIATVGYGQQIAVPRYWFNVIYLLDGVPLLPVVLGIFALPELVELMRGSKIARSAPGSSVKGGLLQGMRDAMTHWWLTLRCSVIGAYLGIIPGLGAAVADWIAYGHAVQTTRDNPQFGKGDVRGVIAPESANNATKGGALIPTIAFGIPGSPPMALLLGGLLIQGIAPGPSMLTTNLSLTFSLIWTLVFANIIASVLLLLLARYFAKLIFIPGLFLVPAITVFTLMGAWMATFQIGDWLALFGAGALGLAMKKADWPRAPLILGFIIAPILENSLHISRQSYGMTWIGRPVVLVLLAIVVLTVVMSVRARRRQAKVQQAVVLAPEGLAMPGGHVAPEGHATDEPTSPVFGVLFGGVMVATFAFAIWEARNWPAALGAFPIVVAVAGLMFSALAAVMDWRARANHRRYDTSAYDRAMFEIVAWMAGIVGLTLLVGQIPALLTFTFLFLLWRAGATLLLACLYTAGMWLILWGLFDQIVHIVWSPAWLF
ncbi:tripartite tricarboxylate transporter permease [Pararhodobacter sp.]|uniref:tripartite tricarboxylate transporter permease n=1 Tax=Pararhodobacter sp. TaxID=2127056 RepID=UPI002FDE8AD8